MRKVRVIVIGSGPAGLTGALYTSRAQHSTVVITGKQLGGQIATTDEVENFPGFPDGTTGPQLTENMRMQAEKFGTEFIYDTVTEVDFSKGSPFYVKTDGGEEFSADSVLVTIGANPRELGIPGEREHIGRGVSYCATCDGFFFRGKKLIVAGGGDSALQEALFLTKFASEVTIVHRRDELRAGAILQERAKTHPKIKFIYSTVIEEIKSDSTGLVGAARLRDVKTNQVYDYPTNGVFVFIGYDPNSALFGSQLALNDEGYAIVDPLFRTNVEGVYAAGEIHDNIFRQAITAAGQGCSAALMTIKWLDDREARGLLQPLEAAVPENS